MWLHCLSHVHTPDTRCAAIDLSHTLFSIPVTRSTRLFFMICTRHPEAHSYNPVVPLQDTPVPWWWREIHPVGTIVRSKPACTFCFKEKMARYVGIHRVMVCEQWFGWMVMNLKGARLEIWWREMWGRGMWIDFSEWEKKWEETCFLFNVQGILEWMFVWSHQVKAQPSWGAYCRQREHRMVSRRKYL